MELKEFVSQTLLQIVEGVKIAQATDTGTNVEIAQRGDFGSIEFDVAITTTDSVEGKGGAGIFVAGISLGAQAKGEVTNQTYSHIKFNIPLVLPYDEESAKKRSGNW